MHSRENSCWVTLLICLWKNFWFSFEVVSFRLWLPWWNLAATFWVSGVLLWRSTWFSSIQQLSKYLLSPFFFIEKKKSLYFNSGLKCWCLSLILITILNNWPGLQKSWTAGRFCGNSSLPGSLNVTQHIALGSCFCKSWS